jgi:hypothetical protein
MDQSYVVVQTPPVMSRNSNRRDTGNDINHPPPMIALDEDNIPATQPVANTRKRRGRTMSGGIPASIIKKAKMFKPTDAQLPPTTPASTKKKNPTLLDLQNSINCINLTMKDTIKQSIAAAMSDWRKECAADMKNLVEETVKLHLETVESSISAIKEQINDIPKLATDVVNHEMEKRIGPIELKQLELDIEVQGMKKREQESQSNTNISSGNTLLELSQKIEKLESTVSQDKLVTDTVVQHQKYLEHLENTKRAKNLIWYGVPEGKLEFQNKDNDTITSLEDADKVSNILKFIGKGDINIVSLQRLGKTPDETTSRPRPILVCLESPASRASVLTATSLLKTGPPELQKIFIKKDVHPAIRKEYARLRKVEKDEKEKPGNQGKTVQYDHETRQVLINGLPIDSFNPQLF